MRGPFQQHSIQTEFLILSDKDFFDFSGASMSTIVTVLSKTVVNFPF